MSMGIEACAEMVGVLSEQDLGGDISVTQILGTDCILSVYTVFDTVQHRSLPLARWCDSSKSHPDTHHGDTLGHRLPKFDFIDR